METFYTRYSADLGLLAMFALVSAVRAFYVLGWVGFEEHMSLMLWGIGCMVFVTAILANHSATRPHPYRTPNWRAADAFDTEERHDE